LTDREDTGSHPTLEGRVVAVETARDLWRWLIGGLAGAGFALAVGIGSHQIAAERETAVAIAEMRQEVGALRERVERADATRDAIADQLGAIAIELGRLRTEITGLSTRLDRMEQRFDGARR